MTTAPPPPQQPLDYEQQARDLVVEARGHRASMMEAHQQALVRYENALWRGAWETGYNQGWKDGYEAALAQMAQLRANTPPPTTTRPEPIAPSLEEDPDDTPTAQEIVLMTVGTFPGLRGVDVVKHTASSGTPVKERTVRTALHRLKTAGQIVNVDERWYLPGAAPSGGA